jgi:hypothetical protein
MFIFYLCSVTCHVNLFKREISVFNQLPERFCIHNQDSVNFFEQTIIRERRHVTKIYLWGSLNYFNSCPGRWVTGVGGG